MISLLYLCLHLSLYASYVDAPADANGWKQSHIMVHACSAAVARATAKAARQYAHARAISHSVRENTLTRPAVVQPTF